MRIQIDEDYAIKGTKHGYVLTKRYIINSGDQKGKEVWNDIYWYTSFDGAINGYVDLMFRTSDAEGVDEAMDVLTQIAEKIKEVKSTYHVVLPEEV